MILPNVNFLHATVLLKQLAACGVRRVVISPGSRSTPLALAAANLPELQTYVLIDERSAAFFALGLSKAGRAPAVLICTSGTAAANYFPAVIEASQSATPLIVLTADRPIALRESGAAQTIHQVHLYGDYSRFFAELPEAKLDVDRCRAVRALAAQAFAAATGSPSGPVHLNVPLDEPLAPVPREEQACLALWNELHREGNIRVAARSMRVVPKDVLDHLAILLGDSLCGLIVAGAGAARSPEDAEAVYLLSRQLGWPLFADITSGLQPFGYPVFPHYDIFLREEELARLGPDVVVMFGDLPTSKVLNQYLDRHRAAHTIHVCSNRRVSDPSFRANEVVYADVAPLCETLCRTVTAARDSLVLEPFRQAAYHVHAALEQDHDATDCEALYVLRAAQRLSENANLVLASSLPIRYADAMLGGLPLQTFALRGANGIDGTISHAAGVAAASEKPTLLVLGDLAFCHDMTGLMAAVRFAPNLSLLLLNNNGGGIFHFLPVHEHEGAKEFQLLHGTPHDLNLSGIPEVFGVKWHEVHHPRDLESLMTAETSVPQVFEVRTEREGNHRAHLNLVSYLIKEATRP